MADSDHSSTPGKSPAFQFYPKDFLTDENVRLMSMQERGIYITLMSYCWIESTLPADTKLLARLCGMPLKQFNNLWRAIAPCFDVDPLHVDRIIHQRLDKERVKQILFKRRQSDNGKRGGRPNKPTEKPEPETQINPSLSPSGLAKESSSSALCTLQSADSSQHPRKEREGVAHTRMGSGVMAGSLPRDHLRHSWCGRVCVPDFLHGQFERSTGLTETTLKAFYLSTFEGIDESEAVEPDAVKFWRPRVAARWPPLAPSSSLKPEDLVMTPEERAAEDARYGRGRR